MKRLLILAFATCSVCTARSLAQENLISNGGFEDPIAAQPTLFNSGSDMGGWLVGGENRVGLWQDSLNAYDGRQYLQMGEGDLISQVVNLSPGREYTLEFRALSTTDRQLPLLSFQVDVMADSRIIANPTFQVSYHSSSSSSGYRHLWQAFQAEFTAQADQERLSFRFGPSSTPWFIIDGVSLVEIPVPEPSSLALVGMAVLGLVARRFNR